MQKARSHPRLIRRQDQAPTACMHTVSGSISLAVRRSFHLSLTVLCTIGHMFVFSLGGWSPQIQSGFLVPRPTRVPYRSHTRVSYTGLSPSMVRRSRRVLLHFLFGYVGPHNPEEVSPFGLGYSPFARRYLGNLI